MQAVRDFFGGYPDGVNFSTLAERVRELPQQLRRTVGAPNADGPTQRYGRISGDHQFHFDLHFEPRSEGGGLCQTGVVVAAATSDVGGQPVPITCQWRRRIGEHLIDIPGIRGSMYHASADDIGMDIVCQAEPPSGVAQGRASGVLGPFELDPITRLSLENLISSGGSRFPVRHFRDQDDPHPRDLQIHVTQEYVKVVHPGADRGREDIVQYTADYPRVVIHPLDTCKFRLELGEGTDRLYHFVALSRTSRDLIALLIRCFHSRKYVATSLILSSLGQNPATPGAPLTQLSKNHYDIEMLIGRLGKELDRNGGQLGKVDKKVRNATNEKRELQEQLKETINSYTESIEKLHEQLHKAGPDAAMQWKLHDAKATKSKLELEMTELTQRMADQFPEGLGQFSNSTANAELAAEEQALKSEIEELRKSITSLAGENVNNVQIENSRAAELTRLKRDVAHLTAEKEDLEGNKAEAEKDKQSLIDNFLNVKKDLDDIQMTSLNTKIDPEKERELASLRAKHEETAEDRNRIAAQLEALDRDKEKQKQQREAALERVMTQNTKLLEERERMEREKTRVSELYQSTMGAIGAIGAVPAANTTAPTDNTGSDDLDDVSVEALREEIRKKTEEMTKREQESESLRSRLRKLAMV
mmetsp:Transcript_85028/g.132877  ORF Transcript_85028/g.132877 Transcript_85028/m.132877 type:complete len:645 (+) Transcript_85028:108-2042(+)